MQLRRNLLYHRVLRSLRDQCLSLQDLTSLLYRRPTRIPLHLQTPSRQSKRISHFRRTLIKRQRMLSTSLFRKKIFKPETRLLLVSRENFSFANSRHCRAHFLSNLLQKVSPQPSNSLSWRPSIPIQISIRHLISSPRCSSRGCLNGPERGIAWPRMELLSQNSPYHPWRERQSRGLTIKESKFQNNRHLPRRRRRPPSRTPQNYWQHSSRRALCEALILLKQPLPLERC